jgi:outer membrane protein TolC
MSLFTPYLTVNYTILDFGARGSRIAEARDELFAANFAFNSVHLEIVFETSRRYYRLLNALGLQTAAQVNLQNAETLEKAIHARMNAGLATITDELEAKSAAAEAGFQLEAAVGQVDIARGDLLTMLGARPLDGLQVQALSDIQVPLSVKEAPEAAIERALVERPELLQRAAEERAAAQHIRGARSAYVPTLSFSGLGGGQRIYGQQDQLAGVYQGPSETWNVSLGLQWNIFDGGRREAELARSRDETRQAQANTKRTEDDVEQQVWTAYIELRTAFRQRAAAIAFLTASQSAYDSSVKSYDLGLRSVVDVVTAQRILAEALSQDVTARTEVLIQLANLSYRTGDLLKQTQPRSTP